MDAVGIWTILLCGFASENTSTRVCGSQRIQMRIYRPIMADVPVRCGVAIVLLLVFLSRCKAKVENVLNSHRHNRF